jgi:acetoin utilization protein AcuB
MDVRRHMTRNPVTISPTDSLRKAWLIMRQAGLRRLPVLDNGRVIGIVTDRDIWERRPAGIVDAVHADGEYLMDHLRVMGIMTLRPITIASDTPIVDAARTMRANKVGALLVVDSGDLLGIITKGDLIDALVEASTPAAHAVSACQS